ncbi:MAG TPA: TetR/AcrR family transcriptional regulator [Desertimonas sp.]|nr:TetR/AcrR family transcriptional regulator [Desertimonas sp.]
MIGRPPVHGSRPSLSERRQLRRRELLDAAIDVIRREGADVTMEEMATAGGISKPILYRHFVDRDGLVAAITEKALVEIGEMLDTKLRAARSDQPPDSIRATIDACFDYIDADPQLYRFIVNANSSRGNEVTTAFNDRMAERIAESLADRLVERGLDPSPAAVWGRAIVGMVQNTAAWWIGGAGISRDDVVGALTDLVWVGIGGSVGDG